MSSERCLVGKENLSVKDGDGKDDNTLELGSNGSNGFSTFKLDFGHLNEDATNVVPP
jgi:hypothetical protein